MSDLDAQQSLGRRCACRTGKRRSSAAFDGNSQKSAATFEWRL